MQETVHGAGRWALAQLGPGAAEGLLESDVIIMAAHAAGAVTRGQGDGLIGEEELGIDARLHDGAMPVLEVKAAADPGLVGPAPGAELAMRIVQTAAIAHQAAARRMSDDFASVFQSGPPVNAAGAHSCPTNTMMS